MKSYGGVYLSSPRALRMSKLALVQKVEQACWRRDSSAESRGMTESLLCAEGTALLQPRVGYTRLGSRRMHREEFTLSLGVENLKVEQDLSRLRIHVFGYRNCIERLKIVALGFIFASLRQGND